MRESSVEKIDRLLERDEFADYWAMKWSDLLRVKAEFPINLWPNAAQAYHHWIRTAIARTSPTTSSCATCSRPAAAISAVGRSTSTAPCRTATRKASRNRGADVHGRTRADKWPKESTGRHGGVFLAGRHQDHGGVEGGNRVTGIPPRRTQTTATFPDGTTVKLSSDRDPREVFADWLMDPKNPWFARNIVNRAWFWLLGRGIIQEPDDIRPDNPPVNPELLAYLEKEFVASHYDLKHSTG
jgi:hypothetical protein